MGGQERVGLGRGAVAAAAAALAGQVSAVLPHVGAQVRVAGLSGGRLKRQQLAVDARDRRVGQRGRDEGLDDVGERVHAVHEDPEAG